MIDKSKIYTELENRIGKKYAEIIFDFIADNNMCYEFAEHIDEMEAKK